MSGNDDGLSPLAKTYQAAAPWLAASWQLVGSVGVGTAMGWAVDRWAGTTPFGLVVGALVGSAAGLYVYLRAAMKMMETKKK